MHVDLPEPNVAVTSPAMWRLAQFVSLIFVFVFSYSAKGQDFVPEQPVPFSVWLDFESLSQPGAQAPALPIWFESFREERSGSVESGTEKTTFRLRMRRMDNLHQEILFRLFFTDLPQRRPVISAWVETGSQQFVTRLLGTGSGLPNSETVVIPVEGVDYVDVTVPGDGASVRGAFLSSLKQTTVRQTLDFNDAPKVLEPFGNLEGVSVTDDLKLLGRVKALIDASEVRLTPGTTTQGEWEFELAKPPSFALVTFEVLNADVSAQPIVITNGAVPKFANVFWPDLADPGYYQGKSGIQYTGWVRAQCVVAGGDLRSGLNKVIVALSVNSGAIVVRNVELQLKQGSQP